jgi:hypothetical protein
MSSPPPPNNFPNNNRYNFPNRNNNNNNANRPYTITDLFDAFRRRDQDEIESRIGDFRKDAAFRNITILGEAIVYGDHDIVHYLLTDNNDGLGHANPNKETYNGLPLFLVNPTDTTMYRILIDAGADPTAVYKGHELLNRVVIDPGAANSVAFLLREGAQIQPPVFNIAIQNGSMPVIEELIDSLDLRRYPEFINALILRGDPVLLRDIVNSDLVFETYPPRSALLTAVRTGNPQLLEILLETGKFSANADEEKQIVKAIIDANLPDMLDLLHRAGLPNKSEYLIYAIEKQARSIISAFLGWGVVLSAAEKTASLKKAIDANNLDLLGILHADAAFAESMTDMLLYAVENNKLPIVQLLLSWDMPVNVRALYEAAEKGYVDMFEILMNKDRTLLRKKMPFKDNKTLLTLAKERAFSSVIVNLILHGMRSSTKWAGFTKGDMELMNMLFDRTAPAGQRTPAQNFAMCPVCLKYTERQSGCKYMLGHNCKESGGYYHHELYERFKSPEGHIYFCTVCGRICLGHRHYDLKNWDEEHTLMMNEAGADPFSNECMTYEHGGNFEEKMARFRKLRATALALQAQIGVTESETIQNQIVQAVWNPTVPAGNNVANLAAEAAGAWRIAATNFPTVPPVFPQNLNTNMVRWGEVDVRRPLADRELVPLPAGSGDNVFLENGDLFRFRHRQPDGSVYVHTDDQLSTAQGLQGFITGINQQGIRSEYFGKCFSVPDCEALIYPEEIQPFVTAETFNKYRRMFNVKFHDLPEGNNAAAAGAAGAAGGAAAAGAADAGVMRGGGGRNNNFFKTHVAKPDDFFQPMTDGACTLKPKGYKPGNTIRLGKLRKTRKHRSNRRATRRERRR